MILINGIAQHQLAASDRGLQFGDGCFTTARVRHGRVIWQPAHLARLKEACQRLIIAFEQWPALDREMQTLAAQHDEAVLKVVITRGSGGRGYSPAGCGDATRIVRCSAYPEHYAALREKGVRLMQVKTPLGLNPLLAGLKHLNRLEQVLIRNELDASTADEALVLDTQGWLVECCAANLFWRKGKQLFTPDLTRCGVAGLARHRLIQQAKTLGWTVACVRETPAVLRDADEVLICNALMPLLPVYQAETYRYSSREFYHQLTANHDEWK
ncbi:aminodeoxychorismate lyase [Erwinia sp. OLTSP20]|uniref:aminodeoxychorismate lyase n=1 Tax=unclassified Erwinia TaxID=2622719 RepID=UPI000C1913B7|nr:MULTISPECIES: aminodeoxychorismate lyase [unclassified Erwinia]PIJ51941.1 aminodeoxychorismate lyase [Erwinia sp. OAMSP11]PIJ74816.1 aminodeoxychorismate lyase [Erwinia sp. OLSSP12]PIJ85202.1 aminodeoxychorismate lyase [Erwinia sp. OLCASP19]PIJ87203.1 aminodeoxychorismate lyase [Erwinia sp. OLMTSP26]PIJ88347.1 aminodeoxychorismate lyase [Erwinia sp. OLMDSP33]